MSKDTREWYCLGTGAVANRPPSATTQAMMACVDWLAECKFAGWPSGTLPDLERIWWRYHDADGKWRLPELDKNTA